MLKSLGFGEANNTRVFITRRNWYSSDRQKRSILINRAKAALAEMQKEHQMSLLSNEFHAALADLKNGLANLKTELTAAEPAIAAGFTAIVNGLEDKANTLTNEAASAVVTEAATVPVFGAALASALTAAKPIVLADLKAAYAALGTFVEGYEATIVPAVISAI